MPTLQELERAPAGVGYIPRPRSRSGQVVVTDNLSANKVAGLCELIGTGAQLLYLRTFSPDFALIEKVRAKNK
jgi:transposase